MPTLESSSLALHFEDRGRGPPLVLISGLASDSMSWLPVWTDFVSRYRVIAPDNRGVGRTRPQDGTSSIEAMAQDCAALIRHLGLERTRILGHSMGGFVAQRLAVAEPDLVDRLILVATGTGPGVRNIALFNDMAAEFERGVDPARWFARFFEWIFTQRFLADPASVQAATRWALEYPYPQRARGFRRQVEAMAAFDGDVELARIRAPTLVIAGREDRLFPAAECEAFARRIPGADFAVIDGAAHAVHSEQPKPFVAAVSRFLQGSGTNFARRETEADGGGESRH